MHIFLANSPFPEVYLYYVWDKWKLPPHFERVPALRGPTSQGRASLIFYYTTYA